MKIIIKIKTALLCAALPFSSVAFATENPNHPMIFSQLDTDSVTWSTASAQDFEPFMGDTFNVLTENGQSFDLKLSDVSAGATGFDRPAFLPRKQSVIVTFKVSDSDQERMANQSTGSVGMFHHALGQTQALVSLVEDKAGIYTVQLILN